MKVSKLKHHLNLDPFFELSPDEYIPNVASLLVQWLMAMEAKKYFLWGPTKEEADVFVRTFQQLRKDLNRSALTQARNGAQLRNGDGLALAVKDLVAGLGRQERATFKVISHMLRKCCYAPNALMDGIKMGLCVRAAIQGVLAIMIDNFDVIFGDMKDVDSA